MVAPAFFTAFAMSRICASFSMAHGPAITVRRGPPISTLPTRTTVFSPSCFAAASGKLFLMSLSLTSFIGSSSSHADFDGGVGARRFVDRFHEHGQVQPALDRAGRRRL